jgi:hypothetical protein
MIVDAHDIADTIDVHGNCEIGGGAAGITLALEISDAL